MPCPNCGTPMYIDRQESRTPKATGITITWNIYVCPECGFESLRRKY